MNLKILNNASKIYLKDKLDLLNNDIIKSFLLEFKGIIICNDSLVYYLKDLGLIKEEYILKDNTYLEIDKYGNIKDVFI